MSDGLKGGNWIRRNRSENQSGFRRTLKAKARLLEIPCYLGTMNTDQPIPFSLSAKASSFSDVRNLVWSFFLLPFLLIMPLE
jgi:hypothetical protein